MWGSVWYTRERRKEDQGLERKEEGQVSPCRPFLLQRVWTSLQVRAEACSRTREKCLWGFYRVHVPTQSLLSGWRDPAVDKKTTNKPKTEEEGLIFQGYLEYQFFVFKAWGFQIWLETGLDVYFPHCLWKKRVGDSESSLRLWAGARISLHSVLLSSRDLCKPGEKLPITSHIFSKLPTRVSQRSERSDPS